ncbi:hypothetical protein BD413DRAFT_641926 [Trametes elegans]|nr:hypothetical protein BD413DRAFT_641926 [Trametes elegans]
MGTSVSVAIAGAYLLLVVPCHDSVESTSSHCPSPSCRTLLSETPNTAITGTSKNISRVLSKFAPGSPTRELHPYVATLLNEKQPLTTRALRMPAQHGGHGDLESGGSRVKHIAAAHSRGLLREVRPLPSLRALCCARRAVLTTRTDGLQVCTSTNMVSIKRTAQVSSRISRSGHTRTRGTRGAQGTRDGMRTSDLNRGRDTRARRSWVNALARRSSGTSFAPRDPVVMVRCRAQVHAHRVRR